jgi:acetyl esterase/lipase
VPAGSGQGPHPVVVVVHGGLWLDSYGRELMDSVCADLAGRGWLAWNLEYRRVGSRWAAGGWPATFADVAAGIDHLTAVPDLADPQRVTVLGHSAGGHLAMWAAARARLPDGAPGARPAVRVRAAVALAGVLDLVAAARGRRSVVGPGVVRLLGGRPDDVPDRYRLASPVERLPLGIPQLLVHGEHDGTVPSDQSRDYALRALEAGDPVELAIVGVGHMDLVDPWSPAWALVVDWLSGSPGT